MNTILLATTALLLQAAALDDFYKFKTDTAWTYKRIENGEERKITGRVTGEEAGKLKLEWKELEKDGSLRETSTVTWSVVDGVLTVEARKEGEEGVLSFGVLKQGSKNGDSWTATIGEFTHQGTAEVTVPAGTYKNATWTRLKIDESKIDFYLVPNARLVKIEIHASGAGENRFELSEFKEPKK